LDPVEMDFPSCVKGAFVAADALCTISFHVFGRFAP
jgi:hypothetical protein